MRTSCHGVVVLLLFGWRMNTDSIQALLDAKGKRKPKARDKLLSELATDLIASGGDENVCVCVRVRPFNHREMDIQGHSGQLLRSVVEMPDGLSGRLRMLQRDDTTGEYNETEVFHFSRTMWSVEESQQPHKYLPIRQEDVFEVVGRAAVANGLGGYNVCVFAYGQTGSGKTHTMMGDVEIRDGDFVGDPGLIPRLCKELFASSKRRCDDVQAEGDRIRLSIEIKLSALEIYNEQVRDLFWRESTYSGRTKTSTLKIRKHPTEGHFVDELTTLTPATFDECVQRIAAGLGERSVAATLMNDESSRSHSVFQIIVHQTETCAPDPNNAYDKPVVTTRISRINLVDLAGSERLKKSGAQGQQLKEAAGINQSLSTLKKVIDALVQNGTERNPKRHVLVPYRESALTQLLSHSLGGNSKTTMIACVSPHFDNQEETLLTLRYANRTKGIVNHVKSNEDNAAKQEKLLRDQLLTLQAKLSEGPHVLNELQLADLRDQLQIGNKALEDLQAQQQAKEREAARLTEVLKGQRESRFASSYYSCFKRVLLERVRDKSQGKLKHLEDQLSRASTDKDNLLQIASTRERSIKDTEYTIKDLKKREELWQLRWARNEAQARTLVRDIAKTKKKADENLMSRFGLVWIRDRNIKSLRASVAQQMEAARKDHEQYLQSIVREAKKQFDFLCSAYADKEAAQQERLAAVERRKENAHQQFEKSRHLVFALRSSSDRASAEHQRRERERQTSWIKRHDDMKSLYDEKISQLKEREAQSHSMWRAKVEQTQREAILTHNARIEDLNSQLRCIDHEGNRRFNDVLFELDTELEAMRGRSSSEAQHAASELLSQFQRDEHQLLVAIDGAKASLHQQQRKLEGIYRYARNITATATHATHALHEVSGEGFPLDAAMLRADAAAFVAKFNHLEAPLDTQHARNVLHKASAVA